MWRKNQHTNKAASTRPRSRDQSWRGVDGLWNFVYSTENLTSAVHDTRACQRACRNAWQWRDTWHKGNAVHLDNVKTKTTRKANCLLRKASKWPRFQTMNQTAPLLTSARPCPGKHAPNFSILLCPISQTS